MMTSRQPLLAPDERIKAGPNAKDDAERCTKKIMSSTAWLSSTWAQQGSWQGHLVQGCCILECATGGGWAPLHLRTRHHHMLLSSSICHACNSTLPGQISLVQTLEPEFLHRQTERLRELHRHFEPPAGNKLAPCPSSGTQSRAITCAQNQADLWASRDLQ